MCQRYGQGTPAGIGQYGIQASLQPKKGATLSPKRLQNEWSLIASVIRKYTSSLDDVLRNIELPEVPDRVPDLIPAEALLPAIKGNELELAVLLAAWLSFSMSEIRGLTKSKSISGDHIRIAEVVVVVGGKDHRKEIAKNKYRNRTHRIPPYIKSLIDKVPGDRLVTLTEAQIYHKWIKFQDEHRFKHMTFHDLRHLNASVMAALRIPDKYAQERGGWKSDKIMKKYTPRPSPKSVLRLIIKLMDILIILQILSRKICRGKNTEPGLSFLAKKMARKVRKSL